jgi:hypothetical protein
VPVLHRHGDGARTRAAARLRGSRRNRCVQADGRQGIPYEVGEKRLKMNAERTLLQPTLRVRDRRRSPIEVVVFPVDGIRQAPASPVDGRPMRRADIAEVEALLADAGQ